MKKWSKDLIKDAETVCELVQAEPDLLSVAKLDMADIVNEAFEQGFIFGAIGVIAFGTGFYLAKNDIPKKLFNRIKGKENKA